MPAPGRVIWHACVVILASAAVPIWSRALNDVDACESKKIYILDLGMYGADNGMPSCDVTKDVKIDPGNGIPYLLDHIRFKVEDGLPYTLAQHSGPWHLMHAINSSRYVTTDMEAADVIYVYDHCYYVLWLAQVHSRGRKKPDEASEAGDWLLSGYRAMLATSRWQRSNGADFVFYDPHPGFTDGTAEKEYYRLICDTFQHAMHIVVERGQRNICKAYWEISKKLLIVPYVPGSTDAARPLLGFEQPIMALEERQTLLFMRATCLPFMWMYPNNTRITTGKARRPPALPFLWMCPNEICITTGKVMRHDVSLALGKAGPNVDVMCTDKRFGGRFMAFEKVMERMRSTLFCLVLPGDSASARRTSEIFMSGCLPVFLGPPYGAMPLADSIDYKAASLFFNVTDYTSWLDDRMVWDIPRDERPNHVCNPWVWIPDAPVREVAIQINTVDEIMDHLRTIPRAVLEKKLEVVVAEREKFSFQPYITGPPSTVNIILSEMCLKAGATARLPVQSI